MANEQRPENVLICMPFGWLTLTQMREAGLPWLYRHCACCGRGVIMDGRNMAVTTYMDPMCVVCAYREFARDGVEFDFAGYLIGGESILPKGRA